MYGIRAAGGRRRSAEDSWKKSNIEFRLLHTSHAFHSGMMEPALGPFIEVLKASN